MSSEPANDPVDIDAYSVLEKAALQIQIDLQHERLERLRERIDQLACRLAELPEIQNAFALRGLGVAYGVLSDARAAKGDYISALEAAASAARLCERVRRIVGDTVIALHDEQLAQARIGTALWHLSDPQGALKPFQRALELAECLREVEGDLPEALSGESHCLVKVGEVLSALGNPNAANERFKRATTLARQARKLGGDTAQTLRDESICYQRRAMVAHPKSESIRLFRKAIDLYHRILAIEDLPEIRGEITVVEGWIRDLE